MQESSSIKPEFTLKATSLLMTNPSTLKSSRNAFATSNKCTPNMQVYAHSAYPLSSQASTKQAHTCSELTQAEPTADTKLQPSVQAEKRSWQFSKTSTRKIL